MKSSSTELAISSFTAGLWYDNVLFNYKQHLIYENLTSLLFLGRELIVS